MKTIYALNDLKEPIKFEVSNDIIERAKEIQGQIKQMKLEKRETAIVYTDILDDLLSGELYTERSQVTIYKDEVRLRAYGWHGPSYIEKCNLLTIPDIFFEEEFIKCHFLNYRNEYNFTDCVAKEHMEEFKRLLDEYDTKENREVKEGLNEKK